MDAHGRRRVRSRTGDAVARRRRIIRIACPGVRRSRCSERQRWLRRVRGLCLASRAARREGRRLRPAHPRAHRAWRADERGGLHRARRSTHAADRCRFDARTREFDALIMPTVPIVAAAHRRAGGRARVQPGQSAHPAQYRARQFLRPLLDQPAVPSAPAKRRSVSCWSARHWATHDYSAWR